MWISATVHLLKSYDHFQMTQYINLLLYNMYLLDNLILCDTTSILIYHSRLWRVLLYYNAPPTLVKYLVYADSDILSPCICLLVTLIYLCICKYAIVVQKYQHPFLPHLIFTRSFDLSPIIIKKYIP